MKMDRHPWLLSLLLLLPMLLFFGHHLWVYAPGLRPTGFIQYDNVSYVAYAQQYLDRSSFGLFYANPFNNGPQHPPIYFQPHILLFAGLLKGGVPPDALLIPFTLICAFGCFRLMIAIYDKVLPGRRYRTRNLVLFAWGGGLLALAGALVALFRPAGGQDLWDRLFFLDPANGWWGLNLGRSLFFSCEAYYHLVFLGTILCLLHRKWAAAWVLSLLLSLSHPFSGLELLLIVGLWSGVEWVRDRKKMPLLFPLGIGLLLGFHLWYYTVYLMRFPEHASVAEQYSLNWNLRFYHMLPAYGLVGALALFSLRVNRLRNFFALPAHRLFACWFVAAFLLVNHEWFVEARQPVHFTRGYVWTPLFLLGLGRLQWVNAQLNGKKILVALLMLVFLSDNLLWIGNQLRGYPKGPSTSHVTPEQDALFRQLRTVSGPQTLLLSNESDLAYLGTVYTRMYPWMSHPFTTPFAARKQAALDRFLQQGVPDSSWRRREVIFIWEKQQGRTTQPPGNAPVELLFETRNYAVFRSRSYGVY